MYADFSHLANQVKDRCAADDLDGYLQEQCEQHDVAFAYFLSSLCLESFTSPEMRVNSSAPDGSILPATVSQLDTDDTVIRYARRMNSPAIWQMNSAGQLQGDVIKANTSILSALGGHGIRSGVLFPYHGIGSEFGLFVACAKTDYANSSLAQADTLHAMSLLGAAIFDAHNDNRLTRVEDMRRSLTKREKECLRWAADGKTAWEIGTILDVSERTAVFHLQNASRKLGANSRANALLKALIYGVI